MNLVDSGSGLHPLVWGRKRFVIYLEGRTAQERSYDSGYIRTVEHC